MLSLKRNGAPFLWNGCAVLAEFADGHKRAYQAIPEARTDIMSNEDDIARSNRSISLLVKNGQSLHQIYLDHVDELMCREKTMVSAKY